jgi:hypothetical protein
MSKKIFSFILAILVLVPGVARADVQYSKYLWPPMWNANGGSASDPLTHYAFDIVDTFNSGSTDYSFIRIPTPGPQPYCSSLEDPGCQELAKKYGWWIIRLLPPCASQNEKIDCIEGLAVTDKSGKTVNYKNTYVYKRSTFTAEPARGLGEGSGTSVWVNPESPDSGDGFAVTVSGDAGSGFTAKSFPLTTFAATVFPFRTVLGNYDVADTRINNQRLEFMTRPGTNPDITCLWISAGKCGVHSDYPTDAKITLTLHLPTELATWVIGRLGDPKIELTDLGSNFQRVSVTANPMTVPMVGGKVGVAQASPAVKRQWATNNCPECEHGVWAVNVPSSGENAFTMMNAFRPFLDDKSMVSIPTWSFSSLVERSPSLMKCTQSGSISGLVTTNATAYQGAPPTFDGTSLNYKVGAMHYTDDGSIFKGTYDLLMPAKTAQCLYGYSSAPVSASVSVTGENGDNNVATTVLSESNGWLHLSADGFTFSNPTIKVKFAKPAAASPTPSASLTPSAASSTQPLKVQWCAKGNVKKKVTALKPTCPAGYKKIAAPTAR